MQIACANLRGVEWDAVRVVLAVARTGSFSGAARLLGVDQTTVSRRIASLERALEVRLFDRRATGYVVTAAANDVLEHAFRMEEEAQALERRLVGRDRRLAGRLRVTVSDAVATYLLLPRLDAFRRHYPDIDLELIVGDDALDLGDRAADVAIRLTAHASETLVGRKVATVRYAIYAAKRYVAAHPDLSAASVDAVTWVRGDERPLWLARNFPRARIALRVGSPMSLVAAIRAGLGLGLLPCFMGAQEPVLVRLPAAFETTGWGLWVLSHPDLRTTARVKALRDFVVKALRAQAGLLAPRF
jgi:DNA-binding transcriptional LysR family regulator